MTASYATLPVHALAPLIERRQLSPVEITRAMLARIESTGARLGAFMAVRRDESLRAAEDAEREIAQGNYRGPWHGVPIGVKDHIAVAGWPVTLGSRLVNQISAADATVVERLRRAGAVIAGKNTMHELGAGVSCVNANVGHVHNPWDERRVPGGSSGGSAAAVSASLVYAALGSDGKGSARIPAAWCGVVALKPTPGLVSNFPTAVSSPFGQLCPITKDVTDCALLLGAIAGYDSQDPTSAPSTPKDYREGLARGIAGLRVGVPDTYFLAQSAPTTCALVEQAVGVLGTMGADVQVVRIPSLQHMLLADVAYWAEGSMRPLLAHGPAAFVDPTVWERAVLRELWRTADSIRAARLQTLIRREFLAVLQQVDVLAVPTTPDVAFPIDQIESSPEGTPPGNQSPSTHLALPFNIVGLPAISVPCGFTPERLPVGLTLAGRPWEEDLILRAAYVYEQATSGGYLPPPCAQVAAAESAEARS